MNSTKGGQSATVSSHHRRATALPAIALAIFLTAHRADAQQYTWTNFAGMPGTQGNADGTGSAARFMVPNGINLDGSGNLYVVDSAPANTVRRVTPEGVVTTVAGTTGVYGSADGTGPSAQFNQPYGVAPDGAGNAYIVDSASCTIRLLRPGGEVTTLAGSPGAYGGADGTGSAAQFFFPNGAAADDYGNLYVADSNNSTIRKVTPDGVVTTLAGVAQSGGSADGTGSAARFWHPYGVAVDGDGNVYVADTANSTIRKITPGGVVTTLAGAAGVAGSADGTGSAARFNQPYGVAVDKNGNVIVADTLNNTIRMVTPGGVVTTIGGTAGMTGAQDGVGAAAGFSTPRGVAVTPGGAIYVSDALNARITQGVPSAPPGPVFSADDDVAFTAGDSSVVIPLLGNLTAPPGGTLSITGVTQGRFGRVTINPDGTLTYTPLKTYKDLDSFTYTVSDGLGGAATGTVIIGNGFVTAEGSYSGPVTNDTPASGNSGAIAITVGAGGRFDGKLSLAGSRYAFKGAFDTGWNSRLSITRPDRPEIAVQLRLDPDNNQITGTVADGAFHSAFTAARPASNPPAQREISPSAPPPGPNGL